MNPIKRNVIERVPNGDDLEIHTSIVTVGSDRLVEVREYTPSLKSYGRGVTLPPSIQACFDTADAVIAASRDVYEPSRD